MSIKSLHDYLISKDIKTEGVVNKTDANLKFYDIWLEKYNFFIAGEKVPLWDNMVVTLININHIYYYAKLDEIFNYIKNIRPSESDQKERTDDYKNIIGEILSANPDIKLYEVINFAALPLYNIRRSPTYRSNITAIKNMGCHTWLEVNKALSTDEEIKRYMQKLELNDWIDLLDSKDIESKLTMQQLMAKLFLGLLKSKVREADEEKFRPGGDEYKSLAIKAETEYKMRMHPLLSTYGYFILRSIINTIFISLDRVKRQELFEFKNIETSEQELQVFQSMLYDMSKNEVCDIYDLLTIKSPDEIINNLPLINEIDDGKLKLTKNVILPNLEKKSQLMMLNDIKIEEFADLHPTLYSVIKHIDRENISIESYSLDIKYFGEIAAIISLEDVVIDIIKQSGCKKLEMNYGSVLTFSESGYFVQYKSITDNKDEYLDGLRVTSVTDRPPKLFIIKYS